VWQFAQCDTTGLAPGAALSCCRPKDAKSLRPAYCQAVATAVRHVSNFASETYYNLIERFFNEIKQCRRIATRYDTLAANYLAFIKLASIRPWMRPYEAMP
jgi:transposase